MSAWAMVYIVMLAIEGGVRLAKHGKPREPYNLWEWIFSAAIICGVLYMGGFFS